MNVETIAPLYPGGELLSAHQLISLHLYLHKPVNDAKESTDNPFGPFISILPRDFDSHPLTWIFRRGLSDNNEPGSALLALLPRSTRSLLNALAERFERDSDAVIKYLVSSI